MPEGRVGKPVVQKGGRWQPYAGHVYRVESKLLRHECAQNPRRVDRLGLQRTYLSRLIRQYGI